MGKQTERMERGKEGCCFSQRELRSFSVSHILLPTLERLSKYFLPFLADRYVSASLTLHTSTTLSLSPSHRAGSYENTGWTEQLARPKKKPWTRFQTLPTAPGGPIIGKLLLSCIVSLNSISVLYAAFHLTSEGYL